MSSVGQALGGIVGGVIGFFAGPIGALRGAQIGMMIGGLIDPPKGPTINGPRLDDLNVQTSTYGAFIPRAYGTVPMVGNVFWVQGDKLIEVKNTATSGGKGGPETTTNTWAYYASFAVGLCEGPIDGVRRIWIGGQLWYDAGSSDLETTILSNKNAKMFTLYQGTDTQEPDPLIQADRGVANTPAYRGLAYIVFDNLPLEKYGNSLAQTQVRVEVVKVGTTTTVPVKLYERYLPGDPIYTPVYNHPLTKDPENKPLFTGWARTSGSSTADIIYEQFAMYADTLEPVISAYDVTWVQSPYPYYYESDSRVIRFKADTTHNIEIDGVEYFSGLPPLGAFSYTRRLLETDKHIFYFLRKTSGASSWLSVIHKRLSFSTITEYAFTLSFMPGMAYDAENDQVILLWNDKIEKYSNDTGALDETVSFTADTIPIGGISIDNGILWNVTASAGGTDRLQGRSLEDGSITHAWSWTSPGSGTMSGYVVEGTLYYTKNTGGSDTARYLYIYQLPGKITISTDTLGNIVQAECLKSSLLEAADIDVSELTDEVSGYRVSQLGAIRGSIDPLRAAWPFDVVQHGYQIKFKRRGSASVVTIPASLLDARSAGSEPGVQITNAREMDLMLPRRVDVSYLDETREYDINKQMSPERTSTDAVGIRSVDLPIVFNAAEAAQKAETLLYLYWLERYEVALTLPPEYSELEPGDVVSITGDAADYELRLTSTNTLPDGRIECQARYNKAAVYTPVARGEDGQSVGATLGLDGPAIYSLLDIPLMRDDDDTAGFPVAMAGYLSGWPGGVLYRSDDGGQTWADLQAFTTGAVIGYATSTLAAHGGTVIDFSSTLAVRLYSGSLASVTQDQMFAGQNWFAYGAHGRWEIIAAATAVLQGDGSYILSDFLRGQRGTEWATGLHAANDRIVLLDAAKLAFISVNSSTIGATRDYRAITTGKALSSDASQSFAYQGINLECLSPVHFTGSRHPTTNDWTLSWTRRSRYDQWRDYVDAPLGEASESYEVDIFSDVTHTTLKRTLTSSTQTVNYSSANQVTDFGSNQSTLYVKIYQLSATVGRGYPLTATITR